MTVEHEFSERSGVSFTQELPFDVGTIPKRVTNREVYVPSQKFSGRIPACPNR